MKKLSNAVRTECVDAENFLSIHKNNIKTTEVTNSFGHKCGWGKHDPDPRASANDFNFCACEMKSFNNHKSSKCTVNIAGPTTLKFCL